MSGRLESLIYGELSKLAEEMPWPWLRPLYVRQLVTKRLVKGLGALVAEVRNEDAAILRQRAAHYPTRRIFAAGLRHGALLLTKTAMGKSSPATPDTLPAWLYQRFMPAGVGWDNLTADDREYWEHQARAVRRAVERGGFRTAVRGGEGE